jgi:hypothetical protein
MGRLSEGVACMVSTTVSHTIGKGVCVSPSTTHARTHTRQCSKSSATFAASSLLLAARGTRGSSTPSPCMFTSCSSESVSVSAMSLPVTTLFVRASLTCWVKGGGGWMGGCSRGKEESGA